MNIRRIAVGAGLGFAFTMGALAISGAAHAADKLPAVADCPGGAVDAAARLPEKASARAKAVVAQVAAEPAKDEPAEEPATPPPPPEPRDNPKPEAKPEPTQEPEPTSEPTTPAEPANQDDEQEPTTGEPATEPRTTDPAPAPSAPVVEVPADPVAEIPAPVATPAEPAPAPVTPSPVAAPSPVSDVVDVILPADDPAPLPDADAPAPKPRTLPTPAPVALPPLPVQLPVVIGPIPADAEPTTPATVGEFPDAAAVREAPECDALDAVHVDQGLIRQLIASLTTPDAEPAKVKATPGCPSTPKPAPEQPACTGTTTASGSASSNGAPMYADTTTTLALPTLDRLEHARARSTIPTSRHVAIEPGPA